MDNFFTRFRTETIVAGILLAQVILLALQVQVTAPGAASSVQKITLLRSWGEALMAPLQKSTLSTGSSLRSLWSHYVDLHHTTADNERLQAEVNRMRLDQAHMQQDAAQGHRLQSLLQFKEQFIAKTLAAQVIGTSGTDISRVIYVDRGTNDGVTNGMAVVTPDGIVGKVLRVDSRTSQVLLINDTTSGAGVMLERQRIKGVLKGSPSGRPEVLNIMADEKIEPGDKVITTGGDGVYPKGLPVGTVESVAPDKERDPFLAIKVKPAVNLSQMEEVLIITQLAERDPDPVESGSGSGTTRAADLLSLRLPSAKKKTDDAAVATANGKQDQSAKPLASDSVSPSSAKPSTGAMVTNGNGKAEVKKTPVTSSEKSPVKKTPADGREVPR